MSIYLILQNYFKLFSCARKVSDKCRDCLYVSGLIFLRKLTPEHVPVLPAHGFPPCRVTGLNIH